MAVREVVESLWTKDRAWRAAFVIAFVAGLVARLTVAITDAGQYWPDEVYQSVEPAHRMAFGYSLVAWEFVVGARNVLLPGVIAVLLKALAAVGLDDPRFYLPLVRSLFAGVSMLTIVGAFRLARGIGSSFASATMATVALSLMSFDIFFAPRAMSEIASAAPVTWGLALVFAPERRRGQLIAGASLLGLAVLLRIHCGLFAVGALGGLLAQRRFRDAVLALTVLLGWAFIYGALDWWSWGDFLHSGIYYLRFNVIEGRAAEWGVQPPAFYTKALTRGLGAHWVVLSVLALLGARRAPIVVALAGFFLLGHMAMPHKELRFIVPMFALLCVGASAGLEQLWRLRWWAGALATVTLLSTSLFSFATHRGLTQKHLGRYEEGSAYDSGGSVTRLLMQASHRADLCGLGLTLGSRGATYGVFALHRDVPFYQSPLPDVRFYNYVIAEQGTTPGEVVASDGDAQLIRVRDGSCEQDSAYEPYLDERTRTLANSPESRLHR